MWEAAGKETSTCTCLLTSKAVPRNAGLPSLLQHICCITFYFLKVCDSQYFDIFRHIKSNLLTYAEMKNLDLHISVIVICTLVYTRHMHTAWIKVLGHTFQSLNSGVFNLTE